MNVPLGKTLLVSFVLTLTLGVSSTASAQDAELVRRAEGGDADAQYKLGVSYDVGEGVAEDDVEAVKWYRKAAEQAHSHSQYNLGVMYRGGKGVPKDDVEALKWTRKAAEHGDSDAQHILGIVYGSGLGVPKDDVEALKWTRKAAEQGVASAQFDLGLSYLAGEGVAQDYVLAHMWWNLARVLDNKKDNIYLEKLIPKMTNEQIAEAQKMAREWQARRQGE
jgi:TPR repeat protein